METLALVHVLVRSLKTSRDVMENKLPVRR